MAEVNLSLSQDFSDEDSCNSSQDSKVDASREDITESSGEWREFEEPQRTAVTEFPEEENGSSIAMVKKNKSFMRICDQNERDVMKEMRSNRYEEHDDDDSFILFEHNPSEEDSDKSSHEDENLFKQQSQQTSSGQLVGNPELPSVDVPSGLLVVNGSSETKRASHPQVKVRKDCQADVPVGEECRVQHPVLDSSEDTNDVVLNSSANMPSMTEDSSTATAASTSQKEPSTETYIPVSTTGDSSSQNTALGFPSSASEIQDKNRLPISTDPPPIVESDMGNVRNSAEDSKAYSTSGHHTTSIGSPSTSTDKIGQPSDLQTGSSELVIAQGGGKLRDIKEGTEDHSSGKIKPEDVEDKFIRTTVSAISQFHRRKAQQSSTANAQQQPTSGNYNEEEVLCEVYCSVLLILETATKILVQTETVYDMHNRELLFFCERFLGAFPAEQTADLPTPAQLVGMRNAAAHANTEYRLDCTSSSQSNYLTPSVVLYEKKRNSECYEKIYSCSTDELSHMCCKLRKLFLDDWEPVRKFFSLPASANSREDEVVSVAEEESESTNTKT